MTTLSIIIPTLNEAKVLPFTLQSLQALRKHNVEVIIVDGGSDDDTLAIAEQFADIVISSKVGRARQLNKGAKAARSDLLLFLHADTQLPINALELLNNSARGFSRWGRFNVKLDDSRLAFRLIEKMMNWRSCLTGIVTGDQAMFVSNALFEKVGGYPDIELMEDIAISKTLKKYAMPICLNQPVLISARRWQEQGVLRTVLLMWQLRWAYFFKKSPLILAEKYQKTRLK
ncbi:MAG: TIGR04283 family arsenosugar biosynthesis glycosyltransferase [Cycloclasticus sp.]